MATEYHWLSNKLHEVSAIHERLEQIRDQLANEGRNLSGDDPSTIPFTADHREEVVRLFSTLVLTESTIVGFRMIGGFIKRNEVVVEKLDLTPDELMSGTEDLVRRLREAGATKQEIRIARATADLVAALVDAPPVSAAQATITEDAERLLADAADRAYDVGETTLGAALDLAEDARDAASLVGREVRDGLSRFFRRNRVKRD